MEARWTSGAGTIAPNRWLGAINKQALARLWWAGELLRDGGDYSRVERFFDAQDLPNSCLHRPFVRVRPVALALVDELQARTSGERIEADGISDLVNNVARNVNLWLGTYAADAAFDWEEDAVDVAAWRALPFSEPGDPVVGPPASQVAETDIAMARALVGEICEVSGLPMPGP